MVSGTLRVVLWILGGLAVLWLILGLAMLPTMGRMMGMDGMMDGGMMGMAMGSMMTMMGLMAAQFLAMLGLVGIFAYLLVDSVRNRPPRRTL